MVIPMIPVRAGGGKIRGPAAGPGAVSAGAELLSEGEALAIPVLAGAAMGTWILWLIAAAVFGVAEIATTTLAFGLIAAASLVGAMAGGAGAPFPVQFGAFVVAAAAGLGIIRPIAVRHMRQPPLLRSGTAALVGKTALVLDDVSTYAGRVRIGGEEWSARPYDETLVIPAGATVDVLKIDGATALVYPRE